MSPLIIHKSRYVHNRRVGNSNSTWKTCLLRSLGGNLATGKTLFSQKPFLTRHKNIRTMTYDDKMWIWLQIFFTQNASPSDWQIFWDLKRDKLLFTCYCELTGKHVNENEFRWFHNFWLRNMPVCFDIRRRVVVQNKKSFLPWMSFNLKMQTTTNCSENYVGTHLEEEKKSQFVRIIQVDNKIMFRAISSFKADYNLRFWG